MQSLEKKDVIFGAGRVYTVVVPGPKWKSWVKYGFIDRRDYKVQWSSFDNDSEEHAIIDGASSFILPGQVKQAKNSSYFAATITGEDEAKTVTVYVRKEGSAVKIIGFDRSW